MSWRFDPQPVPRDREPEFSRRVRRRRNRGRRATDEGIAQALDVVASARLWRETVGAAIDGALR